ncbi:MAG: putative dehydrogenase [Bacteroidetes bacterium]|jgi:predicted dehydrogenase|nr:putative dehydrogenase [Bacteroidota bacterium]MDF2453569.1 putative dehydrogenase [Bacteroidota bacterium]
MNIGIAGLGHLGKIHLKLAGEIPQFNVSAVYDVDKTVLSSLSYQNNVKTCESFEELLTLCDAVLIITPTPTHFDLAARAIKNGKHVFIEKPATDNTDDTKKLIQLAKEAGVIAQVGHVERFNPAFIAAKEFIQNPLHIDIQRLACYNPRGTDVSVVLDLMIHDIDLVLTTVKSKIRKIFASGAAIVSKTSDFAHARIEFENGCIANLTTNRIAMQNTRHMSVFQKDTFINIDLLNKTTLIHKIQPITSKSNAKGIVIETGQGQQNFEILQNQPIITPINAIKTELECFYKSITENAPIAVSLADAESALQVIKSIELQINPLRDIPAVS